MRYVPLLALLSILPIFGCAATFRDEPPLRLTGRWHRIHERDTIASVAAVYGVDANVLTELNDLQGDADLTKRTQIFVPMRSGERPGAAPLPAQNNEVTAEPTLAAKGLPAKSSASKSKTCSSEGNPCLTWPLTGKIGASFDTRASKPHDGIDILAEKGDLIRAAAKGKVLYSGAEIKGYGNLVILRHKDGILTVYAHNDKNLVAEGAEVEQGAVIAEAGQSGNASAVHLHFEVRVAEVPRNPLEYLPEF